MNCFDNALKLDVNTNSSQGLTNIQLDLALSMTSSRPHQIVLCCSLRAGALALAQDLAATLRSDGWQTVLPTPPSSEIEATDVAYQASEEFILHRRRVTTIYFRAISHPATAAVIAVNPDEEGRAPSYIGPSVFAELAVAYANDKSLFALYDLPTDLKEELRAFNVRACGGDDRALLQALRELQRQK